MKPIALVSLFSTFIFSASVFAEANPALEQATQAIQTQLKIHLPNAPQASVSASDIAGLYQVTIGSRIVYMSADGRYVVNGSIIDLATRENKTEMAEAGVRKAALAALDENSMIRFPAKGKTKGVVNVFTDIDCGYCQKLHREVPKMNEAGIEVRYLSYPRSGVDTPSYDKAVSVWCAKDPQKAMNAAMLGQAVPEAKCQNPVRQHMALVHDFGVNGTPNLVLDSGDMIPGYITADKLVEVLGIE